MDKSRACTPVLIIGKSAAYAGTFLNQNLMTIPAECHNARGGQCHPIFVHLNFCWQTYSHRRAPSSPYLL